MLTKRVYRLLSCCLIIVAVVFFLYSLLKNLSSVPRVDFNLHTLISFLGTILLYLGIIFMSGCIWYSLLRATGESVNLRDALTIFSIAQFARYIPGNIFHHVSRVVLAETYGAKVKNVVFVLTLEAGWGIASSSFLALVSILFAYQAPLQHVTGVQSVHKLILVAIAAGTIPIVIGYVFRNPPQLLSKMIGKWDINVPNGKTLVLCFVLNMLAFITMGLIIDIIARRVFGAVESQILATTAVYSVGWIIGLLTPGAPAGLGIRESAVILGLTPIYGGGISLGIAMSTRIVTIAGDCLSFLVGILVKRFSTGRPVTRS